MTTIKPAPSSKTLNAYLIGLGGLASTAATSSAAIVVIDTGPGGFDIGGINAGVDSGTNRSVSDFPAEGEGQLVLSNEFTLYGVAGLSGSQGLTFAYDGGWASPTNLNAEDLISDTLDFASGSFFPSFYVNSLNTYTSPDFGPGSYMAFRTDSGNFGWLEVTWNSAAQEFEILAGAYNNAGDPIAAGAIPEPSSLVLLLGGAAGLYALRRRRKNAAAS